MFGRNGDQLALDGEIGRRRRWPWIVGILVVVALLAAAFMMMKAPKPGAKGADKAAETGAAKKGDNAQLPTVTFAKPGMSIFPRERAARGMRSEPRIRGGLV